MFLWVLQKKKEQDRIQKININHLNRTIDNNNIKITNSLIMSNKKLFIDNPEIISFYEQHPNINIESINLFFIDVIKKLSTDLSSTLNDNNISKLLSMVTEMNNTLGKFDNLFTIKLMELKKDYVDELKTVLNNNMLNEKGNIQHVLERNHDNLVAKTQLLLNEFMPRSQEGYYKLDTSLKDYFATINSNTKRILEQTDRDDNMNDHNKTIIDNIDNQFNKMVGLIQQPICSFIQSSEDRTMSNLQQVKDNIHNNKQSQDTLAGEMNSFLNKYKNNSNKKGNISETELYYVLQKLMPSDEIIRCGSETATCDFKVNRCDSSKPTILFENKNYTGSVDTEEIKKFERDVQLQKKHGIFLSQNSPITFKSQFHIDIIERQILVYVPNAEYDPNKIRVAIDIVDKLAPHVEELVIEKEDVNAVQYNITTTELAAVVKEYSDFGIKKMEMIDLVKSTSKQMLDKMEDMQMPQLNKYLLGTGQYKNDKMVCSFCGVFNGKNKSSLAAHMRNCKQNPNSNINKKTVKEPPENVQVSV